MNDVFAGNGDFNDLEKKLSEVLSDDNAMPTNEPTSYSNRSSKPAPLKTVKNPSREGLVMNVPTADSRFTDVKDKLASPTGTYNSSIDESGKHCESRQHCCSLGWHHCSR